MRGGGGGGGGRGGWGGGQVRLLVSGLGLMHCENLQYLTPCAVAWYADDCSCFSRALVQSSEEMDRGLDDYWKEDGAALGEGGGPGGLNPALDDFFGGSKGGA